MLFFCLFVFQVSLKQGMDWIDNFHHIGSVEHGDLYMYGFHANKFVVWSSKSGDCLFTLECGGGHRSWSFDYLAGKLAYLKAGVLNLVKVWCLELFIITFVYRSQV